MGDSFLHICLQGFSFVCCSYCCCCFLFLFAQRHQWWIAVCHRSIKIFWLFPRKWVNNCMYRGATVISPKKTLIRMWRLRAWKKVMFLFDKVTNRWSRKKIFPTEIAEIAMWNRLFTVTRINEEAKTGNV